MRATASMHLRKLLDLAENNQVNRRIAKSFNAENRRVKVSLTGL